MPKTGLKVCGGGGGGWVVCKPILVFSLGLSQAEQYPVSKSFLPETKFSLSLFPKSHSTH